MTTIPELDDDTDPGDFPVWWGGAGYTIDAYGTKDAMENPHVEPIARIIIHNDGRHYQVGWYQGGEPLPWVEGPTFDGWTGDAKSQAMRHVCDAFRCSSHRFTAAMSGDSIGKATCDGCGATWYPGNRHRQWYGITPRNLTGGMR